MRIPLEQNNNTMLQYEVSHTIRNARPLEENNNTMLQFHLSEWLPATEPMGSSPPSKPAAAQHSCDGKSWQKRRAGKKTVAVQSKGSAELLVLA